MTWEDAGRHGIDEILARLEQYRRDDVRWKDGRAFQSRLLRR
ncbi:MAG: hypothetical protein WKF58_13700 [Ilumatobacteraceae bacterium]